MTFPSSVKLAEGETTESQPGSTAPPRSLQRLWFAIQRLEWSTLVVLPAGPEISAHAFGGPLHQVGALAMGDRLRLIDATTVELRETAPLILDMASASPVRAAAPRNERVMVLLESVLSRPTGIPIALAADAAVLCVELGKTTLASARETIEIVGAQRFVGCVVLPPR